MSLCTLDEVKEYLGITHSDLDDLINSLITRMSAFIERYCGRVFEATDYTEEYDGESCNDGLLLLNNYPVLSFTSLKEDSTRQWGASTEISSDKYVVYEDEGTVRLIDQWFDRGFKTIQAVYRAGYEAGNIPGDLSQACVDLVAYKLTTSQSGGGGIKSRRLADASITYANMGPSSGGDVSVAGGMSMPTETKSVLDMYKSRRMYVL